MNQSTPVPKPPTVAAVPTTMHPQESAAQQRARQLENLKKVRQLREDALRMRGRIRHIDPTKSVGIHYSWVNVSEVRVNFYKSLGYEICKDPNVLSDWRKEDGTHHFGDLILMQIPEDLHAAYGADREIKALEGVEGEEVFKAFADRSGIPVSVLK